MPQPSADSAGWAGWLRGSALYADDDFPFRGYRTDHLLMESRRPLRTKEPLKCNSLLNHDRVAGPDGFLAFDAAVQ